ncbi:D-alanyl-D-alanine carboxypeptidase/D-alanyl-D-alanine endopeptidase [Flaviflexus equikiangi]|uniref:D-alanyl-D-alanine carboxypeptidase/D-alanyl-D-alanine-endopeptidase n=1 Tax=Flaviflexus equikiangi TaxID=2758573 RepID=A0ABS2TG66_9ACTO|nr:D-alanyl-D-alanine carboxypeptidase/D-alanyl-D-alanine-endopeptidase [Flaviflexus equikiangi]MBM9433632.1 D-alanyl-D-alanine carboxypeptidase/D-alanyl-D-alanine-endopeptidase [Flaviflexus equikiangi]
MKARSQAGIVAVLILLGGYVVADAVDIAPGILTATDKPLEPRAYPEAANFEAIDADVPVDDGGVDLLPGDVATIAESLADDPRNTGETSFVVRELDGTLVYDMRGGTGRLPASSMKVLTAAAALEELGPNTTLDTRAIISEQRLYLVGGGDIYLSSDYGDEMSAVGRAGLADLADQTVSELESRGLSSIELSLDSSLFTGTDYHENVVGSDRQFIMPMRPIAIDGGIIGSVYSTNPDLDAVNRFAELLSERGIEVTTVTTGTAPAATDENTAGIVSSAPIRDLVDYTLTMSDNSLAQVLGHLVAQSRGLTADFDGSAVAVKESLVDQGYNTTGLIVSDAAGLSIDNRVSAHLLTSVLVDSASCGCDTSTIPHSLPVAGLSGTLWSRFEGLPTQGLVRAKTGTLIAANSLTGYVTTESGQVLAFSILIDGLESGTTGIVRPAIDEAINALAMGDENAD